MKAIFFAIATLLCLLQSVSSQMTSGPTVASEIGILPISEDSFGESGITSATTETSPFIETELGLPTMRDKLTITESSQELSFDLDDIDSSYGKMMQDFAATIEDNEADIRSRETTRTLNPAIAALISFIVEVIITLVVLKIAFQLGDYRFHVGQILPLSLVVAAVGAALGVTLDLGLFNPARIGLSFITMLILLRFMTHVHEWATVIQMTFIARLICLGMTWLIFMGMMVLFGL